MKIVEIVMMVVVALMLILAIVAIGYQYFSCESAGGVPVKGMMSIVCLVK